MAKKQLDKLVANEIHSLEEYILKREHLLLEFLMKDSMIDLAPAVISIEDGDSLPILNSSQPTTPDRDISWGKIGIVDGKISTIAGRNIDDPFKLSLETIEETKGITGFLSGDSIDVSYNWTTRTITLTGDLRYAFRGEIKTLTSPWTSVAHPATQSNWFLSSTDGTSFVWNAVPWDFYDVMVAAVRYGATAATTFAIRETHGIMDYNTHEELHSQVGTYLYSGGKPTSGTYAETTASDAATTPGFNVAVIKDEDVKSVIPVWNEGSYTTLHIEAGGIATFTLANPTPFTATTNTYVQVNNVTTGAMTAGINDRFYNVYQVLIPATSDSNSQQYRMVMLQPQATYLSLSAAQAEDIRSLNFGDISLFTAEYVTYTRITYYTQAANGNIGKCTIPTGGISYVVGSRASQLSVSGIATNNHSVLSNLIWSLSGHIGTSNSLAAFDATGLATEVLLSTLVPYTGAINNVNLGTYSLITPNIIGGSSTTQDLTFKTTSGVGATGADMHFLVGNNGATEAMTILNNGNVGIGTTAPAYKLEVFGGTAADGIRSAAGYDISLLSPPPAPTYTLSSGGSVNTGLHAYFVTYTTGIGETNAGGILIVDVTAGNNTVNLTIPVSTDTRVTGRKIYRTKAGATYDNEYLLATISNNTNTTYTDIIADASLTGQSLQSYRVNSTSKFISVNGVQSMVLDRNLVTLGLNAGQNLLGSYAPVRSVYIGANAGKSVTTGQGNVVVGEALYTASTASSCTIMGDLAGGAITTGYSNTFIGAQSGRYVSVGYNNVALGGFSGRFLNDGSTLLTSPTNSIYIGLQSKGFAADETNAIVIGYNANGIGSNSVVLGNDAVTKTLLKGNVGVGTTTPTASLHIKAGTATANTAPIKLTAGTDLTTPETGAIEYDGTNLHFTPASTRETIAYLSNLSGLVPYTGANANVNLGTYSLTNGETSSTSYKLNGVNLFSSLVANTIEKWDGTKHTSITNAAGFLKNDGIGNFTFEEVADTYVIINQVGHGFSVGNAIKPTDTGWVKTKADSAANAGTVGIVSEVIDVDNFRIASTGQLLPGTWTPNKNYYLSVTTAGLIFVQSEPEVWDIGDIKEFIGSTDENGDLYINIDIGLEITESMEGDNVVTSVTISGGNLTINQSNADPVSVSFLYQPLSSVLTAIAAVTGDNGILRKTSGVWSLDSSSSWNSGVQTLTGGSAAWNVVNGLNAIIQVASDHTITFSNLEAGMQGNLSIKCSTSSQRITFAGYNLYISQSIYDSGDSIMTSAGTSKRDKVSWFYDGETLEINGQKDYK